MLTVLAALGLAALPAALIILYVRRLDRARPEPVGLIGKSVLFGFVAVLPAAALEIGLGTILPPLSGIIGNLVESFLIAGLIEESVKLAFLRRYLFRRPEFDERADGIVYAVCVSLGFAFAENIMYGFDDMFVLFARAFTAVPGHAIFSGVMGYYLGIAKIERNRRGLWKTGLLWATILHGLYDFFLLSGKAAFFLFPLLLGGAIVLRRLFRSSRERDEKDRRERTLLSLAAPLL